MAGMLQITTYLLCFYLVVKGIEVLQIALASGRTNRRPMIVLGGATLAACVLAALAFATLPLLLVWAAQGLLAGEQVIAVL